MTLKVLAPTEVLVAEQVTKVKAEAENGWFCVLPRHVDFVTSLVPGVLVFEPPGRQTEYVAIDYGVMVKCGAEVSVSTRNAARGASLGAVRETVERRFRQLREQEQAARSFEAKLEGELVRRLLEWEKYA